VRYYFHMILPKLIQLAVTISAIERRVGVSPRVINCPQVSYRVGKRLISNEIPEKCKVKIRKEFLQKKFRYRERALSCESRKVFGTNESCKQQLHVKLWQQSL
jgi:hypothetical protein